MKITALVVADRATVLWKLRSSLYLAERCEMWEEGRACLLDRALRAKEGKAAEDLCHQCAERDRLWREIKKVQRLLTSACRSWHRQTESAE